ncbi:MAG: hypothetical protein ACK5P7_02595 [Bdellovibrio sp.]|jgi:hypothetical protein
MRSKIEAWAQKLRTPQEVQLFLRRLTYNQELNGVTLRSAEQALVHQTCHCLEASFIAAAILEKHGHPPRVMSLESQDGLDHVVYVFEEKGLWGSISRSREEGLHGRAPKFKTWRALAESYCDPYVDDTGKVTAFRVAHLDESKCNWRSSKRNVWVAERYLLKIKHEKIKTSKKRYQDLFKNHRDNGPIASGLHWW